MESPVEIKDVQNSPVVVEVSDKKLPKKRAKYFARRQRLRRFKLRKCSGCDGQATFKVLLTQELLCPKCLSKYVKDGRQLYPTKINDKEQVPK